MKCVKPGCELEDCPLVLTDFQEYSQELLDAIEVIANMMANSMTGNSDCDDCSCLKLADAHDIAKQLISRGYCLVKVKDGGVHLKPELESSLSLAPGKGKL